MTITIEFDALLKDFKEKSHLEVAVIADHDARYRAEAGTEKIAEIKRDLGEGARLLEGRCARFLSGDMPESANNAVPSDSSYIYVFDFTERRGYANAEALSALIESFIVHYALSKFYASVSQAELSNKHSTIALEASNNIDILLYTKHPPRI